MNKAYTYILASKKEGVLYTGVTSDLFKRVWEHKNNSMKGFTYKYNVKLLVYYEEFGTIEDAILREKQIKGWVRKKKVDIIEKNNPNWDDLSEKWFE